MRICPCCQTQNREEATICFYCGSDLNYRFTPVNAAPTQPIYPQPVYAPPSQSYNNRPPWSLLIAGLSLLLVIAFGAAALTMIIAARNGMAGLGAQLSTELGQVFGGAGPENPAPVGSAPKNTPTPTDPPQRTATPNPTQVSIIDRLLSPQCKSSLEQLSTVSDHVKNDPLKVLDETWRKDLDQATANMKTFCGSLDTASPIPGNIGQVQKSMEQATSEFDQAKLLWNQAIDQHDPGKAVSAAEHVAQATTYLSQAISLLQKIIP